MLINRDFSFSKKYLAGEAHYGFWNVVSKGVGLFNTFFIISSLSVYEYGVFQLLLSIFGFFSDSSALGAGVIGNDIARLIGGKKEPEAKRLFFEYNSTRLAIGLILAALLFFSGPILSLRYQGDFLFLFKLLGILLLAEVIFSAAKSLLKLNLRFAPVASRSSFYKLIQLTFLVYFFFFSSLDLRQVVIAMIAGSILSSLSLIPQLRRAFEPWQKVKMAPAGILRRVFRGYGKWDVFKQVFSRLASRLEPWLIKLFISTEAVGIFSVAVQMADAFKSFLPSNVLGTLVPRRLSDQQLSRRVFVSGTKFMTLIGGSLAAASWIIAPIIVTLFFKEYLVALPFFYFITIDLFIQPGWRMIDIFLIALREQKFFFGRVVARTVEAILLLVILLPLFGLWGAAIKEVFLPLSLAASSYWYLARKYPQYRLSAKEFFSITPDDRFVFRTGLKSFADLIQTKLRSFFG